MNERIINNILKTEQTPLYVFHIGELKHRVTYLRKRLPENVELCYAVKANPFIIDVLANQVEWLEVCSPGELQICRELEISEKKIVLSGVYKEEAEMERLISGADKVGYYTVESICQFILLQKLAKQFKRETPVILRLTSGNQFGLDQCELTELVAQYQNDPWIRICGLQYYSGTQKNSIKKLAREIQMIDDYLDVLNRVYRFRMPKLEYGPGLPVSYFERESFDEDGFLNDFSEMLSEMRYSGVITLEIGRSLAAGCGTYLTKIVDVKRNHGENYAVTDGGMHQIVYYGQSMAMKRPRFSLFPSRHEGELKEWNICGALCTVNDFFVKRTPLCGLQAGDVLAFENAGAYCMTEGISLFLSRDLPEIVRINEDETYSVVRKRIPASKLNAPL